MTKVKFSCWTLLPRLVNSRDNSKNTANDSEAVCDTFCSPNNLPWAEKIENLLLPFYCLMSPTEVGLFHTLDLTWVISSSIYILSVFRGRKKIAKFECKTWQHFCIVQSSLDSAECDLDFLQTTRKLRKESFLAGNFAQELKQRPVGDDQETKDERILNCPPDGHSALFQMPHPPYGNLQCPWSSHPKTWRR